MKHTTHTLTNEKRGSALLVTLLVVSLLLVVVITFVTVVRMELRTVVNHQQLLQARAHARLGAEMAVARLQELAGPDTRVTAPANVGSGEPPVRRRIGHAVDAAAYRPGGGTGTLNLNPTYTQTLGYFLSYDQASGFDLDAFNPFNGDGSVRPGYAALVDFGSIASQDDRVAAPELPVQGPGADRLGGYAFWISDDGLKAQINVTDPLRGSGDAADRRARATTTQRVATERVLPGFDPASGVHNEFLERSLKASQLNLTGYGDTDFAQQFFHDVTLQSLGLPSNTRRGGLKRDLTAVLRETEENFSGLPSGSQYNQLLAFQEARINRWRRETEALPATQPATVPDRHWNAMNVFTLRPEQADPRFRTKMFPPMTDMAVQWDAGGAPWENLLTWNTLRQRRENTGALLTYRRWEGTSEVAPVIAKFVLSNYFTVDWPNVSMHWIPAVVLWNPYDHPIRMNPAQPWSIGYQFDTVVLGDFWFRLKVRHPNWAAPNTSNYSHIQPRDELWTPKFPFHWGGNQFRFHIRDVTGGTNVVIPPGEARIYTMHDRHVQVPADPHPDRYGRPNSSPVSVTLSEGLDDAGQFSLYITADYNDYILNNNRSRINDYIGNTYADASGGYNHWHTTGTRNRTYGNLSTRHLPYPFPLNTNRLESAHVHRLISQNHTAIDNDPSIAVNDNGLNGWQILAIGTEIGRHNEGGSNLRNVRIQLYNGNNNMPMVEILHPNQQLPSAIQAARSYDADNPWAPFGLITPVWSPISTPSNTQAFTPATPGFPAWGFSYGLRLPDHSYVFNDTTSQGSAVAAPIRWLMDFNPLDPFQNRDPASRMPQPGGWRFTRGGFKSASAYVGGFFMGDDRYSDLSWSTPNDLNQFIGHSDDILPGYGPGMVPRAITHQIPESSEDLASIASFMHAPLVATHHEAMTQFGNTPAVRFPHSLANSSTNNGFMQPAHAIGNAHAHFVISRERGHQSFFASVNASSPAETIPYSDNQSPSRFSFSNSYTGAGVPPTYTAAYDASWVYNESLWDDFILTPDANTRLQWQPPYHAPGTPQHDSRRDFTRSAERVLISGAFNVNSQSIPAWAMLLESMLGVDVGPDTTPEDIAPFTRFLDPPGDVFEDGFHDYESPEAYQGYRRLTRDQIWDDNGTPGNFSDDSGLAVEIVRQVQLRGPFLSLSDFVNRGLLPSDNDPDLIGLAGALQSAIHEMGLNDPMGTPSDLDAWIDPALHYSGTYQGGNAFTGNSPENAVGRRNDSAPGALMQADILSRIGSVLSARSDTFTIRAYGAIGDQNNPTARAWCEVTVQRVADYVDADANVSGDLPASLSPINAQFGRQFRVISFRWLGEEEI